MRDLYLLTGVLVGSRLVCDKQILNQSIITTIFNSMHVTAHVENLVLAMVGEMNKERLSPKLDFDEWKENVC